MHINVNMRHLNKAYIHAIYTYAYIDIEISVRLCICLGYTDIRLPPSCCLRTLHFSTPTALLWLFPERNFVLHCIN